MEERIPVCQMIGFAFTGILGTFLHFMFDLSGGNIVAALFSAVNESIWEHMKLLFYPMAVFAIMESFVWGKEMQNFWCIKLVGILLSLILVPVMYYTYTGILGVSADWFNIAIFFLAAGAGYFVETKMFQKAFACKLPAWGAIGVLLLIGVAFTVFTFATPEIPFFRDPQDGSFGYHSV